MDKYIVSYDKENDILYLKVMEVLDAEGLSELVAEYEKITEGKRVRYMLVDMTESSQFDSTKLTKQMRNAYKDLIKYMDAEKTAIYGASPALRMVSKIAIAVSGASDTTRFCKTKEEALAWLKGE